MPVTKTDESVWDSKEQARRWLGESVVDVAQTVNSNIDALQKDHAERQRQMARDDWWSRSTISRHPLAQKDPSS